LNNKTDFFLCCAKENSEPLLQHHYTTQELTMKKVISYAFIAVGAAILVVILLMGVRHSGLTMTEVSTRFFFVNASIAEPTAFEHHPDGSITVRMSWAYNGNFVTCKNKQVIDHQLPHNLSIEKSGADKFCQLTT
jgi:hypothetical protein